MNPGCWVTRSTHPRMLAYGFRSRPASLARCVYPEDRHVGNRVAIGHEELTSASVTVEQREDLQRPCATAQGVGV
jgi:hypothetical protein